MVNKKTWFSHLFRTQKGFGFPYKISGKQVAAARKYSRDLWQNDKWPGATRKLEWLLEKFKPVPEWHDNGAGDPAAAADKHAPPDAKAAESWRPAPTTAAGPEIKKGLVYYTDNRCEERVLYLARRQIALACPDWPLVSVSQYPIDFGHNIVLARPRGALTMFEQILAGLRAVEADVVFLVEHDMFYHPSHFEFMPPRTDTFYYNEHTYKVDAASGQALFFYTKQTSGVCAFRDLLLEHYEKRVARVKKEGFTRRMGFEPGTHKFPRGIDDYPAERWMSPVPNVDVRHASNLTASRFKKEQYRSKRSIRGWKLTDDIPGWGRTKGRFDEFCYELSESQADR